MAYALGRRVEYYDMPTIRDITRRAEADDHRISSFILGVVGSPPSAWRGPARSRGSGRGPLPGIRSRLATQLTTGNTTATNDRGPTDAIPQRQAHLATHPSQGSRGPPSAFHCWTPWSPQGRLWASTPAARAADRTRLVCIEQVHGAAGCNDWGATQNLWSPAETGRDFDLSPSSLRPLEPFRKHLTIVSDTDARMADAYAPSEIGGDHFRTSAVFLTQAHPKQTEGSDVRVGTSMDQLYVQRFGQDTPIPSLQLSIENVDQAGGCAYGYACVYTDTISWASPSQPCR